MAVLSKQFKDALSAIEPGKDATHAAEAHAEVRDVLDKDAILSKWGLHTVLIGSYRREVSIRRVNDADVFCELPDIPAEQDPQRLLDTFVEVLTQEYGDRVQAVALGSPVFPVEPLRPGEATLRGVPAFGRCSQGVPPCAVSPCTLLWIRRRRVCRFWTASGSGYLYCWHSAPTPPSGRGDLRHSIVTATTHVPSGRPQVPAQCLGPWRSTTDNCVI